MSGTDEQTVELPMQELEAIINGALSKRGRDWMEFAFKVLTHVETYTVPQYGDAPDDQITDWSVEDCLTAVKKRLARYGRNARPGQQEMDFMKMAHEIQIAAEKYDKSQCSCTDDPTDMACDNCINTFHSLQEGKRK